MKPKGLAERHQTFSSLFYLIVWKLYQAVKLMHLFQHVIKYAKGFHTDNSPFPQQNFEFLTLLKA